MSWPVQETNSQRLVPERLWRSIVGINRVFRGLLTHIIHEHFCCNCGLAAATSQYAASHGMLADGLAAWSVNRLFSSLPPFLAAPRVRLAWRLRNFATNCYE